MNRRELLAAGAAALAGMTRFASIQAHAAAQKSRGDQVPLVHITDLYHPPQDPDDHVDLATAAALEEYDLKGVILDVSQKFLMAAPAGFDIHRDPGFIPVIQLAYLLGRSIPVAVGPTGPLTRADDDVSDRPRTEQAGVRLLLEILEACPAGVVVSVVGSARALTAAFNRNPGLVRARVRSVLLNVGSTGGPKREWNVALDPEAYVGLWRSGLPIHWYPCATGRGAFDPEDERGTYWKATHRSLFRTAAPALRAWFAYALSSEPHGDPIAALADPVPPKTWDRILAGERNMWATASLVLEAGRVLVRTPEGWRFVPSAAVREAEIWPWRLDRVDASVNTEADVSWRLAPAGGNALLFGRNQGAGFAAAMADALGALLGTLR
jgi:hypothetical protein